MKTAIILTLDLPSPEHVATAIAAIDPPSIPGFDGMARIAVEPAVSAIVDYLDGGDQATADALAGIYEANREAPNPVTRDLVRTVHSAYVDPPGGSIGGRPVYRPTPNDRDDLLTLLRAVYVALPATDKEPTP